MYNFSLLIYNFKINRFSTNQFNKTVFKYSFKMSHFKLVPKSFDPRLSVYIRMCRPDLNDQTKSQKIFEIISK